MENLAWNSSHEEITPNFHWDTVTPGAEKRTADFSEGYISKDPSEWAAKNYTKKKRVSLKTKNLAWMAKFWGWKMKKIFSRRDPLISLGANNAATTEKEPIKVRNKVKILEIVGKTFQKPSFS